MLRFSGGEKVVRFIKEDGSVLNLRDKHGAKVEIESVRDETSLYVQTSEQDGGDVMKVLLENGASVNHKNNRGEIPIDIGRLRDEADKVELLEKYTK